MADTGLQGLLDAFDAEAALTPTHWGKDERENRPYDRRSLALDGDWFFCVKRSAPPRYRGHVDALGAHRHPKGLCHLKVTFDGKIRQKDVAPIFRLGAALATNLRAEYGLVHPIWHLGEESQRYSAAGIVRFIDFQPYGPPGVAALTWFGPHLIRLFGRERLLGAGVPVRETPWGGIEMALTDTPWSADFQALKSRQQAVMQALSPAEVFGRYDDLEPGPGANWVPIPETDP